MKVKINEDEKKVLISKIQDYFATERDEEIGIIAAENILEFFLDELGKNVHNSALDKAKKWYLKKMDDLDVDFDQIYL